MSSADADDPPRSRLFVVCPKGTGQDTLQRAFEDLLAKLSAEDPPFASARGETTTARKDPDEDARKDEHHDDGLDEEDVGDEPPLVKHLESVRVVPRKGVAFAKFSDAATAMRCMAAIADANGALGALRVKCMLAEPKASAGAGAGAAERANGTPPPPPPPPPGGAAATGGPAAAGLGGGVAAGSRPRGERSGEPPGGSASPKRARRGGDTAGDGAPNDVGRGGFPPPPHQTPGCVLGSESRRRHHRTSRTSPTSSAESGGGIGGRGIGRSPVQNPVPSPPPMPPGPPPGVFLGEARMGDGRRGALVFHPRTGGVPTLGVPTLVHPAAGAPPPPPPHYPPPAFAHFPTGTAPHPHAVHASAPNATPNFIHHAHVPGVHPRPNAPPPQPPDWPPPSPAASARSGASSALSGGGGGGGGVTRGGGGGGEVTTSADSDSVRSNGAAGHTRRAFVVLDKTVTQSHLESLFRDTCEGVITVELKTDGHSGKSRGFAYVTFESPAFVQAACERLNGRELPEGSGVRCKVMPALDREHRPTPERSNGSNKRRSNGHGNGNGRGGAGSAAGGASSGEGADRSTRTEAPSPSPESDLAKKKTRTMNEEKEEEEEEEEDEDALSWQLPGPRKYSRLNSPSAGDEVEGSIPPGAGRSFDPDDDGAIHEEEEEQEEEEEEEEEDDDEAESGVEAASSRRLVLRRDASRSKAEEEATDAAMALGKVSLGVVPEEDTTAVLAEGDRTRLLEGGTDAEPSDGTSPDDALDKFEGDGDDGPGGNRTRDLSDRDDDEPADAAGAGETTDRKPVNRRPGKSEPEPAAGEVAGSIPPGAGRVLFFRLALPLPSYALRHVLASHGEVAELSMRPDGASGRVEYVDEEGADAALEALHATEILGIELRVSRLQADVAGKKAAAEGGGADQRKKRTRRA